MSVSAVTLQACAACASITSPVVCVFVFFKYVGVRSKRLNERQYRYLSQSVYALKAPSKCRILISGHGSRTGGSQAVRHKDEEHHDFHHLFHLLDVSSTKTMNAFVEKPELINLLKLESNSRRGDRTTSAFVYLPGGARARLFFMSSEGAVDDLAARKTNGFNKKRKKKLVVCSHLLLSRRQLQTEEHFVWSDGDQ